MTLTEITNNTKEKDAKRRIRSVDNTESQNLIEEKGKSGLTSEDNLLQRKNLLLSHEKLRRKMRETKHLPGCCQVFDDKGTFVKRFLATVSTD